MPSSGHNNGLECPTVLEDWVSELHKLDVKLLSKPTLNARHVKTQDSAKKLKLHGPFLLLTTVSLSDITESLCK